MNTSLAEKLVRQLSESIADILPMLEPETISPETKVAISKLLFAIGKFAEHPPEPKEKLDDAHLKLRPTSLDASQPE